MKKKTNNSNDSCHLPDDENPKFLFSTTNTKLLCEIVTGKIDPKKLAQNELWARGLNNSGIWIGFQRTSKKAKDISDPCDDCDGILQCKDCHVFNKLHE
ncbi:MAG: hypothetical protein WCX48_09745 [Bacteroidales bacterium]